MSSARASKPKPKGLTKSQFTAAVADLWGVPKAQAHEQLAQLEELVAAELKAGRPVTLPGLVKIHIQRKAATAARPGRNPATGEAITIKAKPACNVVKVKAVKALKDLA